METMKKGAVFLVGAGPGDPELITVKGKRLLEEADVIIYAGSLVNPQLGPPAGSGSGNCGADLRGQAGRPPLHEAGGDQRAAGQAGK